MAQVPEPVDPPPAPRTLVLCGPLCAGKTSVARPVAEALGLCVVTGQSAIELYAGRAGLDRTELQLLGARLERERPGAWLAEAADAIAGSRQALLLDAARTRAQVDAMRGRGPRALVLHITADRQTRERRYEQRDASRDRDVRFDAIVTSPLEREAEALGLVADLVIDSSGLSLSEAVAQALRAVSVHQG